MKIGFLKIYPRYIDSKRMVPPVGLAVTAAYVHRELSLKDVFIARDLSEIYSKNPDIVCLSADSTCIDRAIKTAKRIKSSLDIPIILGGRHIYGLPHTLPDVFDIGVLGEGEDTLVRLLPVIQKNGLDADKLAAVPGIVFQKGDGERLVTEISNPMPDLNILPQPDRAMLGDRWGRPFREVIHVQASRGNPIKSAYDDTRMFWEIYREFSVDYVIKDIQTAFETYKTKHIRFVDDIFGHNPDRLAAFEKRWNELPAELTFSCNVYAGHLSPETAEKLAVMRFTEVWFRAESAAAGPLAYYNIDGADPDSNKALMENCRKNNIKVNLSLMLGAPGETENDIKETENFLTEYEDIIATANVRPLVPLPGTRVWEVARDKRMVADELDWAALADEFSSVDPQKYIHLNPDMDRGIFWDYLLKLHERCISISEGVSKVTRYEPESSEITELGTTHYRLIDLVGENKTVLEVGCSAGYLSKVMTERSCKVTGLEIDAAAAEKAKAFCDRVIVGNIETLDLKAELGETSYDAVMCGDVVEHVRDPKKLLTNLREFIKPEGHLVISLPNIAHWSVRIKLFEGNFDYARTGLLDETHLRFFTDKSARNMFEACGLRVEKAETIREPIPAAYLNSFLEKMGLSHSAEMESLLRSPDAEAFQYLYVCAPTTEAAYLSKVAEEKQNLTMALAQLQTRLLAVERELADKRSHTAELEEYVRHVESDYQRQVKEIEELKSQTGTGGQPHSEKKGFFKR